MEPWELKTEDSRNLDSKKTFIIFCEDGAVEPAYFELFKTKKVHVSTIGNSKQHHAQVDLATEYFRENDLIEVKSDGTEVLKLIKVLKFGVYLIAIKIQMTIKILLLMTQFLMLNQREYKQLGAMMILSFGYYCILKK